MGTLGAMSWKLTALKMSEEAIEVPDEYSVSTKAEPVRWIHVALRRQTG